MIRKSKGEILAFSHCAVPRRRPVENEQNLTKIIWYNILSMAVRVGTVAAVGKKGNNTIGN